MNDGYQTADTSILDYELWQPSGIRHSVRGPLRDPLPDRYFAAIGAAQTFGRFVARPFPTLVEEKTGLTAINLGISGAGPSFFLKEPKMLEVANRAEFVIIQVMSGRSVENSMFELGSNQGMVRPWSEPAAKFSFAENEYRKMLTCRDDEFTTRLRAETRNKYASEMIELLKQIEPPKVLLWFSERTPDWVEGTRNISEYWGGYPHFMGLLTYQWVPEGLVLLLGALAEGVLVPVAHDLVPNDAQTGSRAA